MANDHQYKNAKALGDAGAAMYKRESEFADGALQACVEKVLRDEKLFCAMQANIGKFAPPHANAQILEEVEHLLASRGGSV